MMLRIVHDVERVRAKWASASVACDSESGWAAEVCRKPCAACWKSLLEKMLTCPSILVFGRGSGPGLVFNEVAHGAQVPMYIHSLT